MPAFHEVENKKYGMVSFNIEKFPKCCGVSIISSVSFRNVEDINKLYDWFHNVVLWGKSDITRRISDFSSPIVRNSSPWRVNKIIMADRTTNPLGKKGTIYNFCMSQKNIIKGHVNDNPNSSYHTQTFEINRPKDKYYPQNGSFIDQKDMKKDK